MPFDGLILRLYIYKVNQCFTNKINVCSIHAYQLKGGGMFIYKTQAIKFAGSKAKLARYLGITRQAITGWPDRKPIPQKHAMKMVKENPEVFNNGAG